MLNKADLDRLSQEEKNNLLLEAAQAGDSLACDHLIKSGANVECRDGEVTPLMLAAREGHTQACLKLIDHQAKVDALSTGWENTALHYAAQNGKTETCLALLEHGADINLESDLGQTALSAAFQKNHDETCFALLERGASPKRIIQQDQTALLIRAAKAGRKKVLENLVEGNADEVAAIESVAQEGDTQTCLLLVECASSQFRKLVVQEAALSTAAAWGQTQTCLALIDAGANINAKDPEDKTALMHALLNQQLQTCFALIEKGADLTELQEKYKSDLLLAAIEKGQTSICEKLLNAGADLKAALITAAESGNTAMCLTLIERAPEDEKADMRQVAMMGAAAKGKTQTCLDFIERGAVVNGKDEQGRTALFSALAYPETCEALLQAGAAIDATDNKGNTPLMYGVSLGQHSAYFYLINKGANVNAKNNDGLTVLQMAEGNDRLLQMLLDKGADPRGLSLLGLSRLLLNALHRGDSQTFEKWLTLAKELHLQIDTTTLLTYAISFAQEDIISLLLNDDNIVVSADVLGMVGNLPTETLAKLLPNLSIDGSITLKSLLTPQALKAMSDPAQVENYLNALAAHKNNLRQYIRFLAPDSIAHKDVLIAWDIQDAYARVKKFEDSFKHNSETAMSPREMSAAKTAYEVAQNLYTSEFQARCEQHGNDEHEAIESIEKEIRDMLLDKLSAESDEDTKAFIQHNRENLSLGQDETLMKQASHRFNATDNALHIAWRAYDKFSPTTGWINLFTPPTVTSHQYGAGEQSTDEISWDVRKRAAFYFIALKDRTYATDSQDDREGFFIGEIAEIRRAHNEADLQGQDNPSCYPGTIGRIGKMGRGHSQLAVVNPIEQIPTFVQGLLFEKVKDFLQGKDKATQARMIYALSAFTISTIEDTLAGKNVLAAFNVTQEELQEVAKLHNEIIDSLGNPDEIFNQLNEFFKNSNPPIRALVEQEKIYVQRQLIDIAYKGVGPTVAQQFRQEKITNPYSQETPRISMQDFIRPLQQVRQKHQLSFNVMEIARLCSQNNDEQAIDRCQLNGEQRQDVEACLQTVRAKVPALQQKLDEKRELWQELYEALRSTETQVKSENLKAIVDAMVDQGKDIKEAFNENQMALPGKIVDKILRDAIPKDERRKSLRLGAKGSDEKKPLVQNVEPLAKKSMPKAKKPS